MAFNFGLFTENKWCWVSISVKPNPSQDSSGFRVEVSGFRVQGTGFRDQGSGFGVQVDQVVHREQVVLGIGLGNLKPQTVLRGSDF